VLHVRTFKRAHEPETITFRFLLRDDAQLRNPVAIDFDISAKLLNLLLSY